MPFEEQLAPLYAVKRNPSLLLVDGAQEMTAMFILVFPALSREWLIGRCSLTYNGSGHLQLVSGMSVGSLLSLPSFEGR